MRLARNFTRRLPKRSRSMPPGAKSRSTVWTASWPRTGAGLQANMLAARGEHALAAARGAVRRMGYEQAARYYRWVLDAGTAIG